MKYTRYDIKRKKKKKHYESIILISILILALLIVLVISPFIFKNKDQTTAVDIENSQVKNSSDGASFIMVQCGSFKNKDNATKLQLDLSKTLGDSYIIQDEDSNRVIYGIYPESQATTVLKDLSEKKIESSKMTFLLKENDLCNKEIVELISANLQVINTLSNKSIKSVQTEDLKKWTSALKDTDKKSLNFSVLEDLKKHTLAIGIDLSKANIEENYIYLYSVLKKIK